MGDHRAARSGRLRLGAVQTAASYLLPAVVARFHGDHPGVRVILEEMPAPEIGERLRDGRLDLGIGFDAPAEPGLDAEVILSEELVLVGRGGARRGSGRGGRSDGAGRGDAPLNAAEIAALPLTLLDARYCTRRLADAWARAQNVVLAPINEQSSIEALLATVLASGLATILPRLAIDRRARREFSITPLGPTPPRRGVAVLRRPATSGSPLIEAFVAAIRAELAPPPCG
jgi:LysR family cyn operon transcriptional activator